MIIKTAHYWVRTSKRIWQFYSACKVSQPDKQSIGWNQKERKEKRKKMRRTKEINFVGTLEKDSSSALNLFAVRASKQKCLKFDKLNYQTISHSTMYKK